MHKRATWLTMTLTCLVLAVPLLAQGPVRVVVNRDNVNIRRFPAIGAEVLASANTGTIFVADAQSPDGEWLRIQFAGDEAWVGAVVVSLLEGNPDALPVRDPRFIPFGGAEAPRAGFTDQTSDFIVRLPNNGVRIRTGPSISYPVLADAPRFTELPVLGRTADNEHIQVNYQGVLGWVRTEFVEILGNKSVLELPVNGVVASEPPLEFTDENDLFGLLRFMRERLDLAQPSLDRMRQVYTDSALGIPPPCAGFPPIPTDFNIPVDLQQRYNATLDPLIRDFDVAVQAIRAAIELQIEICGEASSQLVITSTPVVVGGLELVNEADILFVSLRRRLDALLPEIGPNDCVFEFGGRVEILPVIPQQDLVIGEITLQDRAIGFCFDASPLNVGYIEILRPGGEYPLIAAVSPLGNPTDFIVTGSSPSSPSPSNLILSPIEFPFEGRYLLVVSGGDTGVAREQGLTFDDAEIAVVFADITLGTPQNFLLSFDENGQIIRNVVPFQLPDGTVIGGSGDNVEEINATVTNTQPGPVSVYLDTDTGSNIVGQILPGQTVPATGTVPGWIFVVLSDGTSGWVQEGSVLFTGNTVAAGGGNVACPGIFLTCNDLITCAEVQACVSAGNTLLDPNGNGIACDSTEGNAPLSCDVPAQLP